MSFYMERNVDIDKEIANTYRIHTAYIYSFPKNSNIRIYVRECFEDRKTLIGRDSLSYYLPFIFLGLKVNVR